MFIYSANYEEALTMWHHKLAHDTIFSYTLSDWFNKWDKIHFDQSAGSSHGVKLMLICSNFYCDLINQIRLDVRRIDFVMKQCEGSIVEVPCFLLCTLPYHNKRTLPT